MENAKVRRFHENPGPAKWFLNQSILKQETVPMTFVDFDKVKANSGGDQELLHELIKMGLERINSSLTDMHTSVINQDWDALSRTIHKLRPILCYSGIDAFNAELIELETDTKKQTGLEEIPGRIEKIIENLQVARCELERLLSELC